MVKGYDPTVSDPSKIVLEYLLRWSTTPNPVSLEQAQKYTKHWLKHSQSTSQIYNSFDKIFSSRTKKPQIVLRKKCSKILNWSYWKILLNQSNEGDENYPAYTDDNKIVVCLNMITNKTELKENLDREMTILLKRYEKQQKQSSAKNSLKSQHSKTNKSIETMVEERDKQLMQSLYEGCRQGYKNYMLDKEIQDRVSKKCAKYLFFRRCERQLPWDAKFRYASKIIEEVI